MNGKVPKSLENIKIQIQGRLHLSLIEMWNKGYRRNGGLGFAVDQPSAVITVSRHSGFGLRDGRTHPLNPEEQENLVACVRKYSSEPVQIEIDGQLPSHYGFGSGTAIRLGCIEATAMLHGRKHDRHALISASGRGGTSGIGINTYFDGGIVLDAGVANIATDEFAPSSAIENRNRTPTVLAQRKMPKWCIGLCIPSGLRPLSHSEEVEFFKRVCPIPREDVLETLYHVVSGAYAAAADGDLLAFAQAVNAIQRTRWKMAERELYGSELITLEKHILSAGAIGVGLSSLGPGLFFFGDNINRITDTLRRELQKECWMIAYTDNHGRRVTD
jgi:beta-ribofuranosylaminobenzene 5'-phosphate synthase